MIWFSALVLIPLMAVVVTAIDGGWDVFWTTITNGQTAAAIRLTVFTALGVTGEHHRARDAGGLPVDPPRGRR